MRRRALARPGDGMIRFADGEPAPDEKSLPDCARACTPVRLGIGAFMGVIPVGNIARLGYTGTPLPPRRRYGTFRRDRTGGATVAASVTP